MVLQARKIAVTCKPLLYQGRSIPMILEEKYIEGAEDATQVKLRQLGLSVGEQFEMDYDYGCTQVFKIRLDAVRDMENGRGTHYPYITDGRGAEYRTMSMRKNSEKSSKRSTLTACRIIMLSVTAWI